jgi:ABC-2 type transport system permease protein
VNTTAPANLRATLRPTLRPSPVKAILVRDLANYFTSPTAYIFITLFVFLSGVAAFWGQSFFARNVATLDELNRWFPALLLLLIPAITMNAWAEERKQGTDELLLTLPATEWQLALGKYLASVAIYAICLLFAASHIIVLMYLGRPDLGLLASTFVGYFLAGAALCAVGLVASSLSPNSTIAYIAAACLCALFVGLGLVNTLAPVSPTDSALAAIAATLTELSIPARLSASVRGVLATGDILYFALIAALGITLTAWLLKRRRAVGLPAAASTFHAALRLASLLLMLGALVTLADRARLRLDATAERLWSLAPQTADTLRTLPADQPIDITAYISPDLPGALVPQADQLRGMLAEFESLSNRTIRARIVETTPRSAAARDADRAFAIKPVPVATDQPGSPPGPREAFLGVAVANNATGQFATIPFLAPGLPVEYELLRALRSVGSQTRTVIGILETPAGLYGSFDFQTMQSRPDWPIISELAKQHTVRRVPANADYPDDLAVLLVAQPSSLEQPAIDRLVAHIRAGKPTIIFEDPFPLVNPTLATRAPRPPQGGPFGRPNPAPKANLDALWDALGARITGEAIVWDASNRRPLLADTPNEFIWAAPLDALQWSPFDQQSPVTAELQEVLLLFAGSIENSTNTNTPDRPTITPLIRSSPRSGIVPFDQLTTRDMFGGSQINPNRRPTRVGFQSTLAAHITSQGTNPRNVILIADLDAFSPTFFRIREQGAADLNLDNVTLALNAIDALAGQTQLMALRAKRPALRTLERIDARRAEELSDTRRIEDAARLDAESRLAEARDRLEAKVREVDARTDIDANTKAVMLQSVRNAEQTRLDAQTIAINDARDNQIQDAQLVAQDNIRKIESAVRLTAVALPPVPALLTGAIVLTARRRRGQSGTPDLRAGRRLSNT